MYQNLTIPSQKIKDFCQPPLHKGALFLKQGCYPINQAVDHTCCYAVDDDGAGDCEHLRANAQDKPLRFELNCWGGYGIGKPGNGY